MYENIRISEQIFVAFYVAHINCISQSSVHDGIYVQIFEYSEMKEKLDQIEREREKEKFPLLDDVESDLTFYYNFCCSQVCFFLFYLIFFIFNKLYQHQQNEHKLHVSFQRTRKLNLSMEHCLPSIREVNPQSTIIKRIHHTNDQIHVPADQIQ